MGPGPPCAGVRDSVFCYSPRADGKRGKTPVDDAHRQVSQNPEGLLDIATLSKQSSVDGILPTQKRENKQRPAKGVAPRTQGA